MPFDAAPPAGGNSESQWIIIYLCILTPMSRTHIAASYRERRDLWKGEWGCSYAADFKKNEVAPLIEEIEAAGRLGRVLLDAGSGSLIGPGSAARPKPILYPLEGKLVVRTDIAMPYLSRVSGPILELQADIENLSADSASQRRRLLAISRHLGIDPRIRRPEFNAMFFFDVLNYVDFRRTLAGLLPFLSGDGRMIISNFPGMGIPEAFSDSGVKSNGELSGFLRDCGMLIEHLYHPPLVHPFFAYAVASRPAYPNLTDNPQERGSMVLVAVREPSLSA